MQCQWLAWPSSCALCWGTLFGGGRTLGAAQHRRREALFMDFCWTHALRMPQQGAHCSMARTDTQCAYHWCSHGRSACERW